MSINVCKTLMRHTRSPQPQPVLTVGGNFHYIRTGSTWNVRRGAAAFEYYWNGSAQQADLLTWNASLLDTQNPDEEVRVLRFRSPPNANHNGKCWIAGKYTGTTRPHIAEFPLPLD